MIQVEFIYFFIDKIDLEDELQEMGSDQQLLSFEIDPQQVEQVKKQCIETELPMLEEYDFRFGVFFELL